MASSSSNMSRFNIATTLIALLVFQVTINPLTANAQLPQRVNVVGQLCCTSTGNCPGLGIGNTIVSMNCTNVLGVTVVLGQATTNATGFFNITVPNIFTLLSIPAAGLTTLPCQVTSQFPLNSTVCPILSTTTGILVSAVRSVGSVVTYLFGILQLFRIDGFFVVQI